ncbi:hypothetical protein pb186bvf_003373 [Paramecium bursaria]
METQMWLTVMKWINILAALFIAAIGIYQIVFFFEFDNFDFLQIWSVFQPLYLILFAAMLLSLEFKPEPVLDQFQFLRSFLGRGVFYIFLGSIAGYQPDGSATKALGWIWGLVLWIVGMFYIVINFCAPDSLDGVKGGLTEKYGTT